MSVLQLHMQHQPCAQTQRVHRCADKRARAWSVCSAQRSRHWLAWLGGLNKNSNSPEAHRFDCSVIREWHYLERIRRCGLVREVRPRPSRAQALLCCHGSGYSSALQYYASCMTSYAPHHKDNGLSL